MNTNENSTLVSQKSKLSLTKSTWVKMYALIIKDTLERTIQRRSTNQIWRQHTPS